MFRLALRLGRTVEELLHSVSSAELTEWQAFDRIDPIGDWRHDIHAAQVVTHMANQNRRKGQSAYRLDRFLLKWEPRPEQTADQQLEMVRMLNEAFSGTVH